MKLKSYQAYTRKQTKKREKKSITYHFFHQSALSYCEQKLSKHQIWILPLHLSRALIFCKSYCLTMLWWAKRQLHRQHMNFCKFHTLLPAKKPWAQILRFGLLSVIPAPTPMTTCQPPAENCCIPAFAAPTKHLEVSSNEVITKKCLKKWKRILCLQNGMFCFMLWASKNIWNSRLLFKKNANSIFFIFTVF